LFFRGLHTDPDVILFYPNAPVQNIYYSSGILISHVLLILKITLAGWTGASRCTPDSGNEILYSVPLPNNFILPSDGNNYGAAVFFF
jgi:hypothetical protein